jgi:predicted GNAT superfamily acetyltransferase
MTDDKNQGTLSDRFRVDWHITREQVIDRISQHNKPNREKGSIEELLQAGIQLLNPARFVQGNWPLPIEKIKTQDKEHVLVEIPADIQAIRQKDAGNAGDWRLHTRKIFETLFADDYQVVDFIYNPGNQPRSFYLMDKVLL